MDSLRGAVAHILGPRVRSGPVHAAIEELKSERAGLQVAKNQLGQDVWAMIETGDPLAALVHGARNAQFVRDAETEGQ